MGPKKCQGLGDTSKRPRKEMEKETERKRGKTEVEGRGEKREEKEKEIQKFTRHKRFTEQHFSFIHNYLFTHLFAPISDRLQRQ